MCILMYDGMTCGNKMLMVNIWLGLKSSAHVKKIALSKTKLYLKGKIFSLKLAAVLIAMSYYTLWFGLRATSVQTNEHFDALMMIDEQSHVAKALSNHKQKQLLRPLLLHPSTASGSPSMSLTTAYDIDAAAGSKTPGANFYDCYS